MRVLHRLELTDCPEVRRGRDCGGEFQTDKRVKKRSRRILEVSCDDRVWTRELLSRASAFIPPQHAGAQ